MPTKTTVENPGEWRLAIRRALERHGVINVRGLERSLSVDAETAREALDYWVGRGEAEILRPCRQRLVCDDEWDYYRWKRTSDKDYLEQQTFQRRRCFKPTPTDNGLASQGPGRVTFR